MDVIHTVIKTNRQIKLIIFEIFPHPPLLAISFSDTPSGTKSDCVCVVSLSSMFCDCSSPKSKLAAPLQARMPWDHVWSNFELAPPQLLAQAPSGAQQLLCFVFLIVPHFGHAVPVLGFAGTGALATMGECTWRVKNASVFRLHGVWMSDAHTFTGLDALEPRVIKLWVADVSTIVEPGTAANTAALFAGFLYGAALRARGTGTGICWDGRRGGSYNGWAHISETHRRHWSTHKYQTDILTTYLCRPSSPHPTCVQNLSRRDHRISWTRYRH